MTKHFVLFIAFFFNLALVFPQTLLKAAVIPNNPLPGEPVSVVIDGINGVNLTAVLVNSQGRIGKAVFFYFFSPIEAHPFKGALLSVPSTAKPGPAVIRVENAGSVIGELTITIGSRDFVSELIPLDERNTAIRTAPSAEKTAQAAVLQTILSRTGNNIHTVSAFVPPTTAVRRTSFFGDRRIYKYVDGRTDTAIHAGIDYGVPTGTPVTACANGRVALAEFRITTGNSVVIEHLPGVYSLYYHLSKIGVREGMTVKTGDLLGESGATGLATGPHLHWEIRIAGENTDPDVCVARPIFDREALVRKVIDNASSVGMQQ
jgi:murein DD-endopeptidase MepM/ murein hydrolase activator NlpD